MSRGLPAAAVQELELTVVSHDSPSAVTGCPRCCGHRASNSRPVDLVPFVGPDEVARMFGAVDPAANEHTCRICGERWMVERWPGGNRVVLGRVAPLPASFEGTWHFGESAPMAEGESRSVRLILAKAGAGLAGELEVRAWNDYVEHSLRVELRRVTAKVNGPIATVEVHGGALPGLGTGDWERFAIKPVARYDRLDQPRVGLFVAPDAEHLQRNMPFRTWWPGTADEAAR